MMEIRELALDLGWDPSGPLNVVLVQPRYEVGRDGSSVGSIADGSRQAQEALVGLVSQFIGNWRQFVPRDYDHIHAVILPEFAVPASSVDQLLDSVGTALGCLVLVAGVERLSVHQYLQLIDARVTDREWVQREANLLSGYAVSNTAWVNAIVIAWKRLDGTMQVVAQRKVTPSPWEQESLLQGDTVNVLCVNGARFAFTICSDMFNTPPPHTVGACPVAEDIIRHCERGALRRLDAIIHPQYNQRPNDDLLEAGFGALLVRSSDRVANDLRGAMVVRVNCAGQSEEDDTYGLSGTLVGGHERYRKETPECCQRRGEQIARYEMRPRRGSVFLLEVHLPSRTSADQRRAGVHPVMRGKWLGLRDGLASLDFREGGAAANPEPYRFGAWRAFQCGCSDILTPPETNPSRDALRAHLADRYQDLRNALWRPNGDCLERWGREVFRWDADRQAAPDDWTEAQVHQLRELVASLTMIHAGLGLRPAAAGSAAAIRFLAAEGHVHCRVASCAFDDAAYGRVPEEFDGGNTGAFNGDVYLVSNATGPPTEAVLVPVTGLAMPGGPTHVDAYSEHPITETCVTVLAVQAIERAVLSGPIGPDDLPPIIESVLVAPEPDRKGT